MERGRIIEGETRTEGERKIKRERDRKKKNEKGQDTGTKAEKNQLGRPVALAIACSDVSVAKITILIPSG